MKYLVRVQRVVKDIQSRAVEIEAPNKDAAEEMVLDRIPGETDFWANAKTEVYDNDPPEVTGVEEITP